MQALLLEEKFNSILEEHEAAAQATDLSRRHGVAWNSSYRWKRPPKRTNYPAEDQVQRMHSVLRKSLNGIAALALFSLSIFFVGVVAYLVSTEVMPAIADGSLNIESSSRVLNILWEGNEIYVLLSAYALLAAACAYGGVRTLRKAIRM